MKPEIKEMWAIALESDEYPKTIGALRSPEGFCCLGVLCDVYLKETKTKEEWWRDENGFNGFCSVDDGVEEGSLPQKVREWAGLHSAAPTIRYNGDYLSLITLNDDVKLTFKQIAQLIRDQL